MSLFTAVTASVGAKTSGRRPPGYRSGNTSGVIVAATTAGSVAKPPGVRVGDVLVVAVALGGAADTVATPTDWVLTSGPTATTGSGSQLLAYLFTKVVDGTEGATLDFTKTGTAGAWRLDASAWSSSAGVDVAASNAVTTAGDTSPILPSVTPTVDMSTLVSVVCCRIATVTVTAPAHFVRVLSSITGAPSVATMRNGPVPASASGTFTATASASAKWVTFTVALKHTA